MHIRDGNDLGCRCHWSGNEGLKAKIVHQMLYLLAEG